MLLGQTVAMVLATVVGLSLGALGSGGSILAIPLLVYVAGIPAESAIGMSLLTVGATSLLGAVSYFRSDNVAFKPALTFAATGMVGSLIGSSGTHLLPKASLMLILGSIMIVVCIRMWNNANARTPVGLSQGSLQLSRCIPVGFGLGMLTGFLGIGGGFLVVPALVLIVGLQQRTASGTSLAIIALNSITGFYGHLRFVAIDWGLLAGFLAFSIGGMVAGITLSGHLPERRLRRLFAATVGIVGVAIIAGFLI